jgi:hypothetical protein
LRFQEVSCFGLKIKFKEKGDDIRATYMPTLSGFRFEKAKSEDACLCQKTTVVEFGETAPPHMRNILTNSLVE